MVFSGITGSGASGVLPSSTPWGLPQRALAASFPIKLVTRRRAAAAWPAVGPGVMCVGGYEMAHAGAEHLEELFSAIAP